MLRIIEDPSGETYKPSVVFQNVCMQVCKLGKRVRPRKIIKYLITPLKHNKCKLL